MILETERLILRAWEENDAEELYKYASDPKVGPPAGWPPHKNIEESRSIIKNVLSEKETYAVVLKSTGLPVGSIGFLFPKFGNAPMKENELEIGYWIGVPYWGMGLIPEAVKLLLERAFTALEAPAVWCGYYDGNIKSRRVQEKCGFTYHHTEKNKPCVMMGVVRTEHFTRITKKEWLKINDFKR